MNPDNHRLIEQRAYALWQAEGQPDGKHEEHWQRALREIQAEESQSPAKRLGARQSSRRAAVRSRTLSSRQPKQVEA